MAKNRIIFRAFLFVLFNILSIASYAWERSVDIGYGYSHDPRHTRYNNSGFLLSADLFPLWCTESTHWSLNGALGQWHTTEPTHQNLTTAAVDVALRYYPYIIQYQYPSYLLGSIGPVYLSNNQFGLNRQGSNVAFQVNLGLGMEVSHYDINLRAVHFSNAYLAHPDQGFTILYLLSVGYLF